MDNREKLNEIRDYLDHIKATIEPIYISSISKKLLEYCEWQNRVLYAAYHKSQMDKENEMKQQKILSFYDRLEDLFKEYNLSISHEDSHGGFIIEDYDETNIKWLRDASIQAKSL